MIICSKTYRDIPLSHRQPLHSGKCSRLHGHSWAITINFAAKELDRNGFVIDFGDLHFLEDWIDENLDHGFLLCKNDPQKADFLELEAKGLIRIIWIESPSCEGIARFLFETFQPLVRSKTNHRVWIQSLRLEEDSKNSALYQPADQ